MPRLEGTWSNLVQKSYYNYILINIRKPQKSKELTPRHTAGSNKATVVKLSFDKVTETQLSSNISSYSNQKTVSLQHQIKQVPASQCVQMEHELPQLQSSSDLFFIRNSKFSTGNELAAMEHTVDQTQIFTEIINKPPHHY